MSDFDLGSNLTVPVGRRYIPRYIKRDRAPTVNDRFNVKLFDEWLDTTTGLVYKLVSLAGKEATWSVASGAIFGIIPDAEDPITANDDGNVQIKAGEGINITRQSDNSMAIAQDQFPGRFQWEAITNDLTAEDKHGYFVNGGERIVITLPEESEDNFTFQAIDFSGNGFEIAQNDGQTIRVGNMTTTTGTSGKIDSEQQGDWITIVRFSNVNFVGAINQGSVDIT